MGFRNGIRSGVGIETARFEGKTSYRVGSVGLDGELSRRVGVLISI